ncbi:putative two-component sensor histidine kinase domain protein, partial [Bacteroides fragilis str. 20793-3]
HHYQHFSDLFYLARKKFQKNFGDITAKALFLHLFSDFF